MTSLLNTLLTFITTGGSAAVIAVLFACVVILIYDRHRIMKELIETTQKVYDSKDSETRSVKDIIDRYYKGNLDLIQTLNEIKIVLLAIQTRSGKN